MIRDFTVRFDLGFAHHCTLVNTQTDTGM